MVFTAFEILSVFFSVAKCISISEVQYGAFLF